MGSTLSRFFCLNSFDFLKLVLFALILRVVLLVWGEGGIGVVLKLFGRIRLGEGVVAHFAPLDYLAQASVFILRSNFQERQLPLIWPVCTNDRAASISIGFPSSYKPFAQAFLATDILFCRASAKDVETARSHSLKTFLLNFPSFVLRVYCCSVGMTSNVGASVKTGRLLTTPQKLFIYYRNTNSSSELNTLLPYFPAQLGVLKHGMK